MPSAPTAKFSVDDQVLFRHGTGNLVGTIVLFKTVENDEVQGPVSVMDRVRAVIVTAGAGDEPGHEFTRAVSLLVHAPLPTPTNP